MVWVHSVQQFLPNDQKLSKVEKKEAHNLGRELVGQLEFTSLSSLEGQTIGSISSLLGRELSAPKRKVLEALGVGDNTSVPDSFMAVGRGFR